MHTKILCCVVGCAFVLFANTVDAQETGKTQTETETTNYCPVYPYAYHWNGNVLVYVSYYAIDEPTCGGNGAVSLDGPEGLDPSCPGPDCAPGNRFPEPKDATEKSGPWPVPTGSSGHNPNGLPLTRVATRACWFTYKGEKKFAHLHKHSVNPPGPLPRKDFYQGWEVESSLAWKEGTVEETVEEDRTLKIKFQGKVYLVQLTVSRK